jgi:hypothetical protein
MDLEVMGPGILQPWKVRRGGHGVKKGLLTRSAGDAKEKRGSAEQGHGAQKL